MNFKLVISDPKGKHAYNKEVEQTASALIGKMVGEVVAGDSFGLDGYKLEVTGGSDREGFPMRRDVSGMARKRLLLASPPGYHPVYAGERKRKSIRGNTVSAEIAQVNLKILESGKKTLTEIFGAKEKAEDKGEKKAETEKQETKKEEKKPEEQKTEKPREEKKADEQKQEKPAK